MTDLVDTHCHIQSIGVATGEPATQQLWAKAGDEMTADSVITAARQAGVGRLICVGCDLADSQLAVDFVQNRKNCWASLGIHPHEAQHYVGQASKFARFTELAKADKVVAIGECGLDYFYEYSPKDAQIEILKFQLELAATHGLPVIFHVREAFDDFWPVFKPYAAKVRGVLHSFTDNQANLERAVSYGLYIGVNGIATFAKNPLQLSVYRSIPLTNLLFETDAPFLTPTPYRGTINEPRQVRTVAEFMANLRGENFELLAKTTTTNAVQLFGLER